MTAEEERARWLEAVRACKCKHGVSIAEVCFACDQEFDDDEAEGAT